MYKTEYYANDDLTDLVLKVDINYIRDSLGFAQERTTTRTWIKENEESHEDVKTTKKYYRQGTLSPIEEGVRRRGNVIKGLQMPILGMMMATIPPQQNENEEARKSRIIKLGRKFLAENKEKFTFFVEDSNREIVEDVQESTDFWIDNIIDAQGTTIRAYIIAQLSIGGLV